MEDMAMDLLSSTQDLFHRNPVSYSQTTTPTPPKPNVTLPCSFSYYNICFEIFANGVQNPSLYSSTATSYLGTDEAELLTQ
jgi:hypothetical protein